MLVAVGGVTVLALLGVPARAPGLRLHAHRPLFVAVGAIGNDLDRLAHGYIADFVHVPHWPVFNVADA